MKRKIVLTFVFAVLLLVGNSLAISAQSSSVISENFDKQISFVAMGDIDCNGDTDSEDLTLLKKFLLGSGSGLLKYGDVKKDGFVNLIDLVRLKKNIAAVYVPTKIENNSLILNGTAYYTGEFLSLLKPNTQYNIVCSVLSADGIEIAINGIKSQPVVIDISSSGSKSKVCNRVFTTGETIEVNSGLELSFTGSGTVYSIAINEISDSWIDGDEQGKNDIF